MSVIVVASVHHSGTKFVHDDLLHDLTEVNSLRPESDFPLTEEEVVRRPFEGRTRIHIESYSVLSLLKWCPKLPVIIPLRHPRDVADSWKRRGKIFRELGNQWQLMKLLMVGYNPYFLPIDTIQRDKRLSEINEGLSLQLSTDWSNRWHEINPPQKLDDNEEAILCSAMSDGFFTQFGYKY